MPTPTERQAVTDFTAGLIYGSPISPIVSRRATRRAAGPSMS
jgi:hypothetical protein